MVDLLDQIEVFAAQLGASPWLLLLVFGLTVADSLLPPVPSETVFITAVVLAMGDDWARVLALVAVAALGAFLGDVLAFTLGRRLPVHRLPGLRGARGTAAIARAGAALDRRGATVVVGRFVPIGRVAVNVGAGALGFGRSRFLVAAGAASWLWAAYTAVLAVGARNIAGGNTLVSVALGMVAALVTGITVEAVLRAVGIGRPADGDGEQDVLAETGEPTSVVAGDPALPAPVGSAGRLPAHDAANHGAAYR